MRRHPETLSFHRGRLPHWEVMAGLYFVTVRLAGSLPNHAVKEIRSMSLRLQEAEGGELPERQRQVFRSMEKWLDRADTVRYLAIPEIARMIMDAIRHRHAQRRWRIIEYVIMPNHIHAFLTHREKSLKAAVEGFKRWTGHDAAKFIDPKGKRFWHRECFDRWSRSPEQDDRFIRYIRDNPVKADLVKDYRDWPYGSWADPEIEKINVEQGHT